MNAERLLRAVRRSRGLSQRELAAHAGVPRSTVGRIESGAIEPRLATFAAILRAAGYHLVVADQFGRLLEVDDAHDRLRDCGCRRFPAHLAVEPVVSEGRDNWWGWRRIAWNPGDEAVPDETYVLRPRWRDHPYYADRRWDDAT